MPRRRLLSQRRLFVGLLTGLATLFGSSVAAWEIRDQPDRVADIIQISLIIVVGSAIIGTVFWTAAHLGKPAPRHHPVRGFLAGLFTALCIVPLPVFASTFKAEFLSAYGQNSGNVVSAAIDATPAAIITGLQVFQVLTKVSLTAAILSAALGYSVARWYQPAGRSQIRN